MARKVKKAAKRKAKPKLTQAELQRIKRRLLAREKNAKWWEEENRRLARDAGEVIASMRASERAFNERVEGHRKAQAQRIAQRLLWLGDGNSAVIEGLLDAMRRR